MSIESLYQLIWMSRPLMQAAETSVEAGLQGTGLTVRMRAILEMLHKHGDQTVPDLAARLQIQRQYVQLMVNETLGAGLTEQRPNPRHKRSRLLALTDQGRTMIQAIITRELALIQTIGSELDDQEVETALRVVMDVTQKLNALAGDRT